MTVNTENRKVGLGVIGLGRAFMLMLPSFTRDERFRLVAATTPSAEARKKFTHEFDAPSYESVAELCRNPEVEAIYIASPHQFHAEHVKLAAEAGKHILVEKPLAISVAEGRLMVEAAAAAGMHLIVGPSHSFDAPVLHARKLIDSGEVGKVRMITAFNFTDFLYRPRRPEELDTTQGGGVVYSQGIHQIDIVRLLGGGMVRSVRALTGNWDPERPTEGAYSALLGFEDGAYASLNYSGYGRFDSDEFMGWVGELGNGKNPEEYGKARRASRDIHSVEEEVELKRTRTYAGTQGSAHDELPLPDAHEHFGPMIVSCEKADLRLLADGVMVYADDERRFEALPGPIIPRKEVMDELYDAIVHDRAPLHSGAWGLASLEACIAILDSAAKGGDEIIMKMQAPIPA